MSLSVSLSNPTREDWERLCAAQPSQYAFMNWSWYSAWGAHLLASGSWQGPCSYAVVRNQDNEIVGAFPHAWQKVGPLKFLSLGGPYGPLRSIPLAVKTVQEVCGALAEFFSATRQEVGLRLGPVENTDPTVDVLLSKLRARGWRIHRIRETQEFVLTVPASLEAYRQLIGNGPIKQAAYQKRRMARRGRVEVRIHSGLGGADWDRVMSEVESIEVGSWVGRKGGLLRFSGAANRAFWADFLRDPAASQATKVWLLYFDDLAVSHCVAVDSGPVRYIITNAYLETAKTFSPGVVVRYGVLEDAIRRGIQTINYGEGDAGYKSRWGFTPARQMHDWLAFPPGLKGAAFAAGLSAIKMVSRITRDFRSKRTSRPEQLAP